MNRVTWKIAAVLALLVAGLLPVGGVAHASHLNVRVDTPAQALVGQPVQLQAHLTNDSGQPVSGATVAFYTQATFLGVTGDQEIARAVTDANGLAVATYEPRDAGVRDIRVDYALPGDATAEHVTATVTADGAPRQFIRQTAGVQIPGLNSWLIIAVVSIVWTILFGVGVTVVRVAHAGGAVVGAAQAPSAVPGPRAAAPSRQREAIGAGVER